jgi:hypothetical protein
VDLVLSLPLPGSAHVPELTYGTTLPPAHADLWHRPLKLTPRSAAGPLSIQVYSSRVPHPPRACTGPWQPPCRHRPWNRTWASPWLVIFHVLAPNPFLPWGVQGQVDPTPAVLGTGEKQDSTGVGQGPLSFLTVLGFELRALSMLDKHLSLEPCPWPFAFVSFQSVLFFAQAGLRPCSSCLYLLHTWDDRCAHRAQLIC